MTFDLRLSPLKAARRAVIGQCSSVGGTLATAGSCLEIMDWNWVVLMVGALSADFRNSVTSVLMASSRSEY